MADTSEPKNNLIALFGVISAVGLFVFVVIMILFFQWRSRHELHNKVALAPTNALTELRTRESEQLNKYKRNAETGLLQIPIERAMELETQGSWRENVAISEGTPANASATTATATTASMAVDSAGLNAAPTSLPPFTAGPTSPQIPSDIRETSHSAQAVHDQIRNDNAETTTAQ